MNYFFTADQHYGHHNIIRYNNRPFDHVVEMNETIIARHNEIVKPADEVYHLGDFSFSYPAEYLKRLNGHHRLVEGNHDHKRARDAGFLWVKSSFGLTIGSQYIWLSHYGHRVWNRSHHGAWHLYGHSHGTLPDHGRSCDVGVDAGWDFYPVSFDQLAERFKDREVAF